MKRQWVVFFDGGKELLRYSLAEEFPGEREETMKLLAYENDIPVCAISFAIITA